MSRYVVAIDGSRPAAAALTWATHRAKSDGMPLVMVHVNEDASGGGHEYETDGSDLPGPTVQLSGSVPRALAEFADPDDVLVIGTGKTGYLHGRVLGSRSVQIAIAASCTVAVIPDVDLRFRRGVVAGVDRHETAGSVARFAAREAVARGEELLLVQATVDTGSRMTAPERSELALADAMSSARAAYPALVIRTRVTDRPAAEALLDSSRDRALLVLGPGSLDPARSPFGSVLHEVLLNVNAPVLINRNLDAPDFDTVAGAVVVSGLDG